MLTVAMNLELDQGKELVVPLECAVWCARGRKGERKTNGYAGELERGRSFTWGIEQTGVKDSDLAWRPQQRR